MIKNTEIVMDFTMIISNLINNISSSINRIISLPTICPQGLCKVPSKCRTQRWL